MEGEPVDVIFRKWDDGGIIALFPCELGTYDAATCNSYMHVGQHGSADPWGVVQATVPATPAEYEPLRVELVQRGYTLRILKRCPSNSYSIRKEKLRHGWIS